MHTQLSSWNKMASCIEYVTSNDGSVDQKQSAIAAMLKYLIFIHVYNFIIKMHSASSRLIV